MLTFDRIFGSGPRIHLTMLSLAVIVYFFRIRFSAAALSLDHGAFLTPALICLVAWIAVSIWAMMSLGRKIGLQVLSSGPYRYVRHPMYTVEIFFGWLVVMFVFNTWLALPAMVLTFLLARGLVHYEEELMKEHFEESWINYAKTTPRFFPRIIHVKK